PSYQRAHLHQAQSVDKTVFEYWTHALSYVPSRDIRFFIGAMRRYRPSRWFGAVTRAEVRKVVALIREGGPLTIRDIDDDVLVEKVHPWASRKPSKRALQVAFYTGLVTINARSGMLKSYELMDRHFGWEERPRPTSERQFVHYLLERGLRTQGLISVDSVCHQDAQRKPAMRQLIEACVRRGELVGGALETAGKLEHWVRPADLEMTAEAAAERVHILSPFDPLVIQRKRLALFFDYEHRFEAYLPKEKRVLAISRYRCWSATRWWPPSISRRTAAPASLQSSNGPGSGGA